ncbi:hypothetical protein AFERRID_29890 [Acidithiobacillus ferridurans]|jgi:hypothetical protein|uniref:Uncharacterized protein n=1 Tax=Acidithiobacillus ferridurans TaxID=1232575 RepID=A0A2Z6ILW0_ACIFI|nr:hypothetical protein AFERRID_29890 [Acidithiobacillus ferridurans]
MFGTIRKTTVIFIRHRENASSQRVDKSQVIGYLTASALVVTIGDAKNFSRLGETSLLGNHDSSPSIAACNTAAVLLTAFSLAMALLM